MASVGAKMAVSTVGVDGDIIDGLFSGNASESDILQLKGEIAKLINEALKSNISKVGFTFYIDDLDRIDPPIAVEIRLSPAVLTIVFAGLNFDVILPSIGISLPSGVIR